MLHPNIFLIYIFLLFPFLHKIIDYRVQTFGTFPYRICTLLLLPLEYFVFAIIFVFVFADCLISTD